MTPPPPWPATWSRDTPLDRSRWFARELYRAVIAYDPRQAEQYRKVAAGYGEYWLTPSPSGSAGEWMTRAQVATRGGVHQSVVSHWTIRGLTARGQAEPRKLTRHPEGYHPDEVKAFLQWRAETRTAPTKGRRSVQCSPQRSTISAAPGTAHAPAATYANMSQRRA